MDFDLNWIKIEFVNERGINLNLIQIESSEESKVKEDPSFFDLFLLALQHPTAQLLHSLTLLLTSSIFYFYFYLFK